MPCFESRGYGIGAFVRAVLGNSGQLRRGTCALSLGAACWMLQI